MKLGRISKEKEFKEILKKGKRFEDGFFIVRVRENGLEEARLGFVLPKKLGKATRRNKLKRRIREIIRLKDIKGWDIIVIAKREAMELDFSGIKTSIEGILRRAGVCS